jgi:heterodisulfide reductase subunit B
LLGLIVDLQCLYDLPPFFTHFYFSNEQSQHIVAKIFVKEFFVLLVEVNKYLGLDFGMDEECCCVIGELFFRESLKEIGVILHVFSH